MPSLFFKLPVSSAGATVQLNESDIRMLGVPYQALWDFADQSLTASNSSKYKLTAQASAQYEFADNALKMVSKAQGALLSNFKADDGILTVSACFKLPNYSAIPGTRLFFGDFKDNNDGEVAGFSVYTNSGGNIIFRESSSSSKTLAITLDDITPIYFAISIDRNKKIANYLVSQGGVTVLSGEYVVTTSNRVDSYVALGTQLSSAVELEIDFYEHQIFDSYKDADQLQELYEATQASMSAISVTI